MISSIWYLCLTLLIIIVGIFIKDKKLAITFNGILAIGIGAITLYNSGIYADEMNLQGDYFSTIIFIISIVLLVILVIVNQKTGDK